MKKINKIFTLLLSFLCIILVVSCDNSQQQTPEVTVESISVVSDSVPAPAYLQFSQQRDSS